MIRGNDRPMEPIGRRGRVGPISPIGPIERDIPGAGHLFVEMGNLADRALARHQAAVEQLLSLVHCRG